MTGRKFIIAASATIFAYYAGDAGNLARAESLPITALTVPVIAVECPDDLSFGTVQISRDNLAGSINIPAAASGPPSIVGTGILVYGDLRPARCVVTNVAENQSASISLSTSDGSSGEFNGGTLDGVYLANGLEVLPLTLHLSQTSVESAGVADITEIYIGGVLHISANEQKRGVFSGVFTLTVTE